MPMSRSGNGSPTSSARAGKSPADRFSPPEVSWLPPAAPFTTAGVEPSFNEILRDPIIRLLMNRDHVDETELRKVARAIRGNRRRVRVA